MAGAPWLTGDSAADEDEEDEALGVYDVSSSLSSSRLAFKADADATRLLCAEEGFVVVLTAAVEPAEDDDGVVEPDDVVVEAGDAGGVAAAGEGEEAELRLSDAGRTRVVGAAVGALLGVEKGEASAPLLLSRRSLPPLREIDRGRDGVREADGDGAAEPPLLPPPLDGDAPSTPLPLRVSSFSLLNLYAQHTRHPTHDTHDSSNLSGIKQKGRMSGVPRAVEVALGELLGEGVTVELVEEADDRICAVPHLRLAVVDALRPAPTGRSGG